MDALEIANPDSQGYTVTTHCDGDRLEFRVTGEGGTHVFRTTVAQIRALLGRPFVLASLTGGSTTQQLTPARIRVWDASRPSVLPLEQLPHAVGPLRHDRVTALTLVQSPTGGDVTTLTRRSAPAYLGGGGDTTADRWAWPGGDGGAGGIQPDSDYGRIRIEEVD